MPLTPLIVSALAYLLGASPCHPNFLQLFTNENYWSVATLGDRTELMKGSKSSSAEWEKTLITNQLVPTGERPIQMSGRSRTRFDNFIPNTDPLRWLLSGRAKLRRIPCKYNGPTEIADRSLLRFADGRIFPLVFNADKRILYDGGFWRVVMEDSNTVSLVVLSRHSQKAIHHVLQKPWEILIPEKCHLSLFVGGKAHINLSGGSWVKFRPGSFWDWRTPEQIEFNGNADFHTYCPVILSTRHIRLKSKSIDPCPWFGKDAYFSIKDYPDDSTPGIAAGIDQVEYWTKRAVSIFFRSDSLAKSLNQRVDSFSRGNDPEMFFEDQQTAPKFLAELAKWYGLSSVSFHNRINKNQAGLLIMGHMTKGLALQDVLKMLESNEVHYAIKGNVLYVNALQHSLEAHNSWGIESPRRKVRQQLDTAARRSIR